MKNKFSYIYVITGILIVAFFVGYYFNVYTPKKGMVERYGILLTHSTSGELRFHYYDKDQHKKLEKWDGYPWFFAVPEDIKDNQKLDEFNRYVESNKDSIFKITGSKDPDDCSYYGNGTCLESITIKKIEAVAR